MKVVYVLIDWDDCRNVHVFAQRRNAIRYAYEHCEAFGAHLSVKKQDPFLKMWQYEYLFDAVGDNNPIDYSNALSDEDLNDVFYEYYYLAEVKIEDAENHERN